MEYPYPALVVLSGDDHLDDRLVDAPHFVRLVDRPELPDCRREPRRSISKSAAARRHDVRGNGELFRGLIPLSRSASWDQVSSNRFVGSSCWRSDCRTAAFLGPIRSRSSHRTGRRDVEPGVSSDSETGANNRVDRTPWQRHRQFDRGRDPGQRMQPVIGRPGPRARRTPRLGGPVGPRDGSSGVSPGTSMSSSSHSTSSGSPAASIRNSTSSPPSAAARTGEEAGSATSDSRTTRRLGFAWSTCQMSPLGNVMDESACGSRPVAEDGEPVAVDERAAVLRIDHLSHRPDPDRR